MMAMPAHTVCLALLLLAAVGAGATTNATTSFQAAVAAGTPPGFTVNLPPGFSINIFAQGLSAARSLAVSGGQEAIVYVGSSTESGGNVWGLWDSQGTGVADVIVPVLSGQSCANGVAWHAGSLFVAQNNAITRYDNVDAAVMAGQPFGAGTVIVGGLPVNPDHDRHYMRIGPDGLLYLNVGSPCNDCVPPVYYTTSAGVAINTATINRMNLDGSNFVTVAQGVRNAVGFDWQPSTGTLYFSNNGIDQLGDFLPDDGFSSLTGALPQFYGYPYCHIVGSGDPAHREAGLWSIVLDPSYAPSGFTPGSAQHLAYCQANLHPPIQPLGPHVASLGVRFWKGGGFPSDYTGSAFVAEHGSSLAAKLIGYRVSRIVLNATGGAADHQIFAQGFVLAGSNTIAGRPVDVEQFTDNSLLISDDYNNAVFRVSYNAANAGGDVLNAGQSLAVGANLTAPHGQYFTTLLPDGNLVTFGTADYNYHGETAEAVVFSSGTSGLPNQPFVLTMQLDCNLVLYDSTNKAILSSNTTGAGQTPCRAQLLDDGTLAVLSAANVLLSVNFAAPPFAGNITAPQSLAQGTPLFSPDGAVFFVVQADGNLVLYQTALESHNGPVAAAAIWAANSNTSPALFVLEMQEDCNLVLYSVPKQQQYGVAAPAAAVWASNTYGKGMAPCSAVVASTGAGSLSVVDATGLTLFQAPAANTAPLGDGGALRFGILFAGEGLSQAANLYSPDGTVYLVVQGDGNLVLYSTVRAAQYGPVAAAAIWAANSNTSPAPFVLEMQSDCNLVLYSVPKQQQYGSAAPAAAVWSSNTYGQGTAPCSAVVSSIGGGSLSVLDSTGLTLFRAPTNSAPLAP